MTTPATVTDPIVRPECGTVAGALAHQHRGEPWCGWCRRAERIAAAEAEALAPPPGPPPREAARSEPSAAYRYAPVTARQATRNAIALAQALDGYDEDGAA